MDCPCHMMMNDDWDCNGKLKHWSKHSVGNGGRSTMPVNRKPSADRTSKIMGNMDKIMETTMIEARVDTVDAIMEHAQKTCPVDRGYLLKSAFTFHEIMKSILGYASPYAKAVHEGTKKHLIPKIPKPRGKALRWESNRKGRLGKKGKITKKGKYRYVFAKQVMHPGTKPNPWVKRSIKKNLKRYKEFAKKRFKINIAKVS